ncbi:hypothetical protein L226DRAFT_616309 [Lentinus tigrinus ALCF2SS1-7]|uniref:uncharacterized protein n=1 Tax=Lentinus tigrinus ALCF2SS1-7 TaxID=1328758 RepID=UPI00116611E1|nr:hypothetical protein L226DRAFT_616309 [Lentinus tigrinus ALCF2SS1-7]
MDRILLKDGPSIRKFYAFLFVDAARRGPHVRALDIKASTIKNDPNARELESLLCEILARSSNLQILCLSSFAASHIPGQESELQHILEGLTTLRELRLEDDSVRVSDWSNAPYMLIKKIRSPIHTFSAHIDELCGTPLHINSHISHLIPTLQDLRLDVLDMQENSAQDIIPCTSVHSLSIIRLQGTCDVSVLLRWFPALKTSLKVFGLGENDWYLDDYARVREQNIRSQKDAAWTHLDEVICDPEVLHVIVTALKHNAPSQLYLSMDIGEAVDVLEDLLPAEAKDRLTHLTLCLRYVDDRSESQLEHDETDSLNQILLLRPCVLWEIISYAIGHLRLTHLRVFLHADIRRPSRALADMRCSQPLVRGLLHIDLQEVAAKMSEEHPSLRYLFITSSGYALARNDSDEDRTRRPTCKIWLHEGGWRMFNRDEDGTRRMEELGSRALDSAIAREEMDLSEEDLLLIKHHIKI